MHSSHQDKTEQHGSQRQSRQVFEKKLEDNYGVRVSVIDEAPDFGVSHATLKMESNSDRLTGSVKNRNHTQQLVKRTNDGLTNN